MKHALVAGGAGFVGSHLCEMLLSKGFEVTALDCLVTGQKKNIVPALDSGLKFVEGDINEESTFQHELLQAKFTHIFNMASPASPVDFPKMPRFILKTASHGHRNLLELARKNQSRILFASSSEVYGDAEVHPQVETYHGNVNSFGARSCYDEAKRFGEALSLAYQTEFGTEIRIARIFNTYGPRMRPSDGRIIPNFFMQALRGQSLTIYGDGQQTRSFCFVTDLIDGLYRLIESDVRKPVNIGNPIERTVLEMAKVIAKLVGSPADFKFQPLGENDPKMRRPDIDLARELLGYEPRVSLEEGLTQCLSYFQSEL